jgi:transcriptional regulator GlxA family with amidase domain
MSEPALAYGNGNPTDKEVRQLLTAYVQMLSQGWALSTPVLSRAAEKHVIDLVALAAEPERMVFQGRRRGHGAARLTAIKATIRAYARDHRLSVSMIAELHRVTARYVHKLFERDGATFSAFVLGERLGLAREMLKDPKFAAHTVASIALDCGFNDPSYFNRTFRRAFGSTPTDIRDAALQTGEKKTPID